MYGLLVLDVLKPERISGCGSLSLFSIFTSSDIYIYCGRGHYFLKPLALLLVNRVR